MGSHIVDGVFQSDKYPTCPPGKFPISLKDPLGQDLVWEYSERTEDKELGEDLKTGIKVYTGGRIPFRASAIAENARGEVAHLVLLNQHLTSADMYRLITRSFPRTTEPTEAQASRAKLLTYIQMLESIAEATGSFNKLSGKVIEHLQHARKAVGCI